MGALECSGPRVKNLVFGDCGFRGLGGSGSTVPLDNPGNMAG